MAQWLGHGPGKRNLWNILCSNPTGVFKFKNFICCVGKSFHSVSRHINHYYGGKSFFSLLFIVKASILIDYSRGNKTAFCCLVGFGWIFDKIYIFELLRVWGLRAVLVERLSMCIWRHNDIIMTSLWRHIHMLSCSTKTFLNPQIPSYWKICSSSNIHPKHTEMFRCLYYSAVAYVGRITSVRTSWVVWFYDLNQKNNVLGFEKTLLALLKISGSATVTSSYSGVNKGYYSALFQSRTKLPEIFRSADNVFLNPSQIFFCFKS